MSSEDEDDDWFYDSIARYRVLLMFDFLSPIKFIELNNYDSICVVFEEEKGINEISHLSLPKKLTVSRENEGLEKGSDLKLKSGGFSQKTITHVKPLFGTNTLIVSEENQQGLNIYKTSDDSGTIVYDSTIDVYEQIAPKICHNKSDVLAMVTTTKQGIVLLDTNNFSIKNKILLAGVEDKEQKLYSEFVTPNLLGVCNIETGTTTLCDLRSMKEFSSIKTDEAFQKDKWTFSSSFLSTNYIADNTDDTKVGLLSTTGIACIYDIRNSQTYLCCEKEKDFSDNSIRSTKPKLQFSPSNSSIISISGFNSNVKVLDYSSGGIKNVFNHDGHVRNNLTNDYIITDHIWFKDSIISACSNLSVHCWQHSVL